MCSTISAINFLKLDEATADTSLIDPMGLRWKNFHDGRIITRYYGAHVKAKLLFQGLMRMNQ